MTSYLLHPEALAELGGPGLGILGTSGPHFAQLLELAPLGLDRPPGPQTVVAPHYSVDRATRRSAGAMPNAMPGKAIIDGSTAAGLACGTLRVQNSSYPSCLVPRI